MLSVMEMAAARNTKGFRPAKDRASDELASRTMHWRCVDITTEKKELAQSSSPSVAAPFDGMKRYWIGPDRQVAICSGQLSAYYLHYLASHPENGALEWNAPSVYGITEGWDRSRCVVDRSSRGARRPDLSKLPLTKKAHLGVTATV